MKVGVVIVSHHEISLELVKATESIVKANLSFESVAVFPSDSLEDAKQKVSQAIQKVDQRTGVLILSDLFGASPCNACLSFLKKGKVELVTGMNLPMVLKLFTLQSQGLACHHPPHRAGGAGWVDSPDKEMSLQELVDFIIDYGQRNIVRGIAKI